MPEVKSDSVYQEHEFLRLIPKHELTEFVNTSDTINITVLQDNGKPKTIKPGESAWLSENDIRHQEKDSFFREGLMRKAQAGKPVPHVIEVRDSMTEGEIEKFVKDTETTQLFGKNLANLDSKNTLKRVTEEVFKQNKPARFLQCIERRLEKLREKELDGMPHITEDA